MLFLIITIVLIVSIVVDQKNQVQKKKNEPIGMKRIEVTVKNPLKLSRRNKERLEQLKKSSKKLTEFNTKLNQKNTVDEFDDEEFDYDFEMVDDDIDRKIDNITANNLADELIRITNLDLLEDEEAYQTELTTEMSPLVENTSVYTDSEWEIVSHQDFHQTEIHHKTTQKVKHKQYSKLQKAFIMSEILGKPKALEQEKW